MAIIDPDGLFNGRRLRACSNYARLVWPYLFLASNGYGRIEIDYFKIVGRAFSAFHPVPSEEELMGCIREYAEHYLLFIYRHEAQTWGQWDCKEGTLPYYKTLSDKRGPAPPNEEFVTWKRSYVSGTTTFYKVCENFPEIFPIGVGVGKGVGLNTSSPAGEDCSSAVVPKTSHPDEPRSYHQAQTAQSTPWEIAPVAERQRPALSELQDAWFEEEFWPLAWRKADKATAHRTFKQHAKTEPKKNTIVAALKEQRASILARQPEHRPYMATWLNKQRYDDHEADPVMSNGKPGQQAHVDLPSTTEYEEKTDPLMEVLKLELGRKVI